MNLIGSSEVAEGFSALSYGKEIKPFAAPIRNIIGFPFKHWALLFLTDGNFLAFILFKYTEVIRLSYVTSWGTLHCVQMIFRRKAVSKDKVRFWTRGVQGASVSRVRLAWAGRARAVGARAC